MSEEPEERVLKVTEEDVDLIKEEVSALDMSDVLKNQLFIILIDKPGDIAYRNKQFDDLEPAPPHTYEQFQKRIDFLESSLKTMTDLESDRRSDIQELNAKLDYLKEQYDDLKASTYGDVIDGLKVELEWLKAKLNKTEQDWVNDHNLLSMELERLKKENLVIVPLDSETVGIYGTQSGNITVKGNMVASRQGIEEWRKAHSTKDGDKDG